MFLPVAPVHETGIVVLVVICPNSGQTMPLAGLFVPITFKPITFKMRFILYIMW